MHTIKYNPLQGFKKQRQEMGLWWMDAWAVGKADSTIFVQQLWKRVCLSASS